MEIERSFFQLLFGILFTFHLQYTNLGWGDIHTLLDGLCDWWVGGLGGVGGIR